MATFSSPVRSIAAALANWLGPGGTEGADRIRFIIPNLIN
jgi:hypothetical protein